MSSNRRGMDRVGGAVVHRLLVLGAAASLAWGAHVSQQEWARRGRPCWDQYCDFAETVRTAMQDSSPESSEALRKHLSANYHANSPVGPFLIASLGLLVSDIMTSYRTLSAGATLGSLLLCFWIARRYLALDTTPSLVAVLVFAAAGPIHRSFLFPQTDAIMMFFFTLAVERLLALREAFTMARYLGLVASLTAALLTKLSALPLLGIAGLGVVWPSPSESWREVVGNLDPDVRPRRFLVFARGVRALPTVVVPLLGAALYMFSFGTTNAFNRELHRMITADSTIALHAVGHARDAPATVACGGAQLAHPMVGDRSVPDDGCRDLFGRRLDARGLGVGALLHQLAADGAASRRGTSDSTAGPRKPGARRRVDTRQATR